MRNRPAGVGVGLGASEASQEGSGPLQGLGPPIITPDRPTRGPRAGGRPLRRLRIGAKVPRHLPGPGWVARAGAPGARRGHQVKSTPARAPARTQALRLLEGPAHGVASRAVAMAHATAILDRAGVDLEVTAHVLEHTGGRAQLPGSARAGRGGLRAGCGPSLQACPRACPLTSGGPSASPSMLPPHLPRESGRPVWP